MLGFTVTVALLHFLARTEFSRVFFVIFLVTVFLGLSLTRAILRFVLKRLRKKGYNQKTMIFIGDGVQADSIATRITRRPELGIRVVGLVQIGKSSREIESLGGIDNLDEILKSHPADEALICLKNSEAGALDQILNLLCTSNIHVRIVPDIFQYAVLGFEVEEFDGVPVVAINESPLIGWNAVLKRMSDIIYSLAALILISPLMLIIGLLVKITSRGPIFYSQERMGLDGRTFKMLKFRSMRIDAEAETGAVWATKGDHRTTPLGSFLRKTSLDELPQFINVLMGDMSCVGPRPERPVFVDKFRHQIPGYMLRHKVKSGITGWAQINGFRGNTSLEGRIEHDLYYITHWSLWLDFRIMVMTVFRGFISPNAY